MIYTKTIETPLGVHLAQSDGERLTLFTLPGDYKTAVSDIAVFSLVEEYFRQYFSGRVPDVVVPVDLSSVTPFCREVLTVVSRIPYGSVMTYGDIASVIGSRRGSKVAAQAVGGAVKHNPAAIIIPCHRVVASNGPGGYFGKEEIKRFLLGFEAGNISDKHI